MTKLFLAIALALTAAACTIAPGNWPSGPSVTVKPGVPPMNTDHGDWQHENRPSAN